MAELSRIPIHRFSTSHNLFLGCDRELIMFAGVMAFALVFSAQTLESAVFGAVFWFVILFLLRLMAKADPQMRSVYMRLITRYKRYYPARSTPYRVNMREYK
jgi:type IV secretion system protein VirB3